MSELLLKGCRIVDPCTGRDQIGELAIRNGVFCRPDELQNPEILNLDGKTVAPGFIDVHVHLRDPGQTHKETLESGCEAAASGGFTTIVAMPNTTPAMDTPAAMEEILARAENAPVHVLQTSAITRGRQGTELVDFAAMKAAGAVAFSDDGSTPQDARLFRDALEQVASLGMVLIDHCEDTSLSKPGVLHEGPVSRQLGLPGQPRLAEAAIVARDILLSQETGCRVHLQHLSVRESAEMLRKAKEAGLKVTGEVTPHHLLLTDEACLTWGTQAKMAPPLRREEDRAALFNELLKQDSAITMIATDHAPHTAEEKARGWLEAPFGIVGIEAAVPLCLTAFRDKMPLLQLISYFTRGPREMLGLPIGSLNIGECADVTILDLEAEHEIDVSRFKSKGRNCPYNGRKCKGKVLGTIKAGRVIWQ